MSRALVALLAAGVLAASCAAEDTAYLRAALTMASIRVEPAEVRHGPVLVRFENISPASHSVVLLRTDTPYDKVVLGQVAEAQATVARIRLAATTNAELKIVLAPGRYVILCAEPSHYENGMRAALAVR